MINNFFYKRYNPYYNYHYGHMPYFASPLNNYYNSYSNFNQKNENYYEKTEEKNNNENKKSATVQDSEKEENNNKDFRLGPFEIRNDRISAFGHSFAIDDLIIVALIVFLFFESSLDYTLLIVLALMLFDISLSSFRIFH